MRLRSIGPTSTCSTSTIRSSCRYFPIVRRPSGRRGLISLPPGLYRGFEVAGKKVGWFFAVLDPHPVFLSKDPIWSPQVEHLAAEQGFRADASGKMVKPDDYAERRDQLKRQLESLQPMLFNRK